MKINYYGHSCFTVDVGNKRLLFDPYIRPNELAKAIDVRDVRADYILISHGHSDHIADAEEIAKRTGATVIACFEVCQWLGKQGIDKTHPMNHGSGWEFDFGRVRPVNAVHSSSMPDGTYGGNPCGFVIQTGTGNFYYSGDTALTMDMRLIGELYPLSFAVLCIGGNFTMGIDEAIKASEWIRCERIIGVHYDTFPLIRIDHDGAVRQFKQAGRELQLLEIGATVEIS